MKRSTKFAALIVSLVAGNVLAQGFPAKPIHLVVGSPPGGIDAYVRLFGPRTSETLGQPVVIENKGGANGAIGADYVARSAPDGYTLLFATSGALVHGVILTRNRPFDPLKDFTPIANMVSTLKVMTVHASLPFTSVKEVIDFAKKNPGKLTYASNGNTTVFHITGELFKVAAGVDILHVPYKGTGAMATELMSGRVDLGFAALNNVKSYIAAGKLKVVAVAEPQRYAGLPNVPTVAETVPNFLPPPSWNAIFGPASMPRPVVERLNAAFVKSLDASEVKNFMEQNGAVGVGGTPDQMAATLKADFATATRLLKETAIQPE